MMLSQYFPYGYAKDVFSIDYDRLYKSGYRALIFDIDNTLVHHNDDATVEVEELFANLCKLGFKTLLLTNNDEERVKRFIKNIDTLYICDANKPAPGGCDRAVEMLSVSKDEVIVIGDQMFMDILCANRCGVASILVHYIETENERWIGWHRYIEKALLAIWRRTRYFDRV